MSYFDLSLEELKSYTPDVAEPADFDAFWERTLAGSRAVGGEVVLADVDPQLPGVDISDMTFPGFNGEPIKAWFTRPKNIETPLPVIVQYQGYGGGRGLPIEHTFWAAAGYAHVMMDTRGQGSNWGNGGGTPDPDGAGPSHPGWMTRGLESPDAYYYRRLITDAVLAVDAARTLPGVDATKVFIAGGSQGGGLTVSVAGLAEGLIGAMPDVPFMAQWEHALAISESDPYNEVRRYLAVHRGAEHTVFQTLSYFDGVNFAKRATAPALYSVGLMDEVCPPSTVFASFNQYGAHAGTSIDKSIEVYPYNGHEGGQGHQAMKQVEFLRRLA